MRHTPSLLTALRMPLRDALRGAATFAGGAEEALESAAAILPEPLRDGFRAGLRAARSAGRGLMTAPIDEGDVAAAADMLAGRARAPDALASVTAYAWAHLRPADQGHLLSETLLAARLAALSIPGRTGAERAAHLVADLRRSPALARVPGAQADAEGADDVLDAIAVWLLAARGTDMAEEEALLDLAAALVPATRRGAPGAQDESAARAAHLQTLADHL